MALPLADGVPAFPLGPVPPVMTMCGGFAGVSACSTVILSDTITFVRSHGNGVTASALVGTLTVNVIGCSLFATGTLEVFETGISQFTPPAGTFMFISK